MKLRLHRLLAAAVLAAVVSSSVYAEGTTQSSTLSGVTLPEGYKAVYNLDNPTYLNEHRENAGEKYMLVLKDQFSVSFPDFY